MVGKRLTVYGWVSLEIEAEDEAQAARVYRTKFGCAPEYIVCDETGERKDVEGPCETCGNAIFEETDSFHMVRKDGTEKMFCDKCFWIQGVEG